MMVTLFREAIYFILVFFVPQCATDGGRLWEGAAVGVGEVPEHLGEEGGGPPLRVREPTGGGRRRGLTETKKEGRGTPFLFFFFGGG